MGGLAMGAGLGAAGAVYTAPVWVPYLSAGHTLGWAGNLIGPAYGAIGSSLGGAIDGGLVLTGVIGGANNAYEGFKEGDYIKAFTGGALSGISLIPSIQSLNKIKKRAIEGTNGNPCAWKC